MKRDIRNWLTRGALLFGAAISIALYFLIREEAQREAENRFEAAALDRILAIENTILTEAEVVHSVVSYFNGSTFVDREEFRIFTENALSRYQAIIALEWIPRVIRAKKSEYEKRAAKDGLEGFRITERNADGKLVLAGKRDEYFPVYYIEPLAGNKTALGFDLGSNPSRMEALQKARDSGEIIASGRINLVQGGTASLLIAPIYDQRKALKTLEQRREALKGFSLGVLKISASIEQTLQKRASLSRPAGIDIYVFDKSAPAESQLLHVHLSRARTGPVKPLSTRADVLKGAHVAHRFDVGGRNWEIVAKPVEMDFGIGTVWFAWGAAVLSMGVTLLFATLLSTQFGRARDVEKLVEVRTLDLKRSEQKVAAIVKTAFNGIITINDRGIIRSVNPSATRLFGYNAEEMVGRNVNMLMPDPYHSAHDGYIANYKKTRQAKIMGTVREVVGKKKDGSLFPIDLAVSQMDVEGELLFTGIVHDISERKQAEQAKSEFISTVSHELRTPLTSIKGSLGLVQSGTLGELPDKLKSMVDIAYKNCNRLVLLINDILDIEKFEAGKMSFDMEVLNFVDLLRSAQDANKGYGEEFGVEIELSCPEDRDSKILGDSDRLMQVMANLISNAVKFSPRGGKVEIGLSENERTYRVSVVDHGPGIPHGFRDQIFGKFRQANSSDTRQKGGTGLGLNISKAIVESHGGIIGFKSETGKGTTFYFEMPKVVNDVKCSPQEERGGHRLKLVVCEDDHDIAKLLTLMLENAGYETAIARSAKEAKDLIATGEFSAMTLDIGLPDQNGLSLIRELRQEARTRDFPIVVVSATAKQGKESLNGDAVGIVDWLEKPIDQDLLTRRLREALSGYTEKRPRLLYVEDDEDLIHVVSTLIADKVDVSAATTLAAARAYLARGDFDLVVLDLMLPDGAGEQLLPELKNSAGEPLPVIIFSGKEVSQSTAQKVHASLLKTQASNEDLLNIIQATLGKR